MEQTRFAARRAAFMDQLGDTIAIIPAGKLQTRNDDVEHSFRQNSDFFFLTGFSEPDSIAVFDPSHSTERYTLFVRPATRSWRRGTAAEPGPRVPRTDLARALPTHSTSSTRGSRNVSSDGRPSHIHSTDPMINVFFVPSRAQEAMRYEPA